MIDVQVAQQWEHLHQTYLRRPGHSDGSDRARYRVTGHGRVHLRGGFIAHDIAVVARFQFPRRAGESIEAYASWMSSVDIAR